MGSSAHREELACVNLNTVIPVAQIDLQGKLERYFGQVRQ